jgi:hypothetical protein
MDYAKKQKLHLAFSGFCVFPSPLYANSEKFMTTLGATTFFRELGPGFSFRLRLLVRELTKIMLPK